MEARKVGHSQGPQVNVEITSGQCVKNGKERLKSDMAFGFGTKTMMNMRKVAGMI